jgi:hypothetical protein
MQATWRPLPAWPYPPAVQRRSNFEVSWAKTLDDLEREIRYLDGEDLLIGVVADPDQFRIDGTPRAGFKVFHTGAEVSFDTPARGRLVFHTDAFRTLQENLRAISQGLTALRAIERYGITTTAEQYAGFAQLSAGGPDPERGRVLVEQSGGIRQALLRHHPDHGGDARAFADVQAFRDRSRVAAAR